MNAQVFSLLIIICFSFRRPPFQHSDEQEREAQGMLARVNAANTLKQRVDQNPNLGGRARAGWTPIDAAQIDDFPRLNYDYLRSLTFGIYQVKLAKNYADEHLKNGTYEVS